MKLLIITQKVDKDDSILGFFHRWIEEFAKHCESIIVICLEKGEYNLPNNVKVLSLGKPSQGWSASGRERFLGRLKALVNFYKYIWQERKNYDAVFVHMNPEYVVLGGWLWRLWQKKIAFWYVHRQVDFKLWLAEQFAHVIFTAAPESFRLRSKKVMVVGHGIDIEKFKPLALTPRGKSTKARIVYLGRITALKNLDVLIEAARLLKENWEHEFEVVLYGEAVTAEDVKYKQYLGSLVDKHHLQGIVSFAPAVPYATVEKVYHSADLTVNLAPTGGLDKAVLESMACGVPVFTSNKAFATFFGEYAEQLLLTRLSAGELTEKIIQLHRMSDWTSLKKFLIEQVKTKFGIRLLTTTLARHLFSPWR